MFTRTAGIWTQQAYLKASNLPAGSGTVLPLRATRWSLGLLLKPVVQRASTATSRTTAPNAGAAYVFTRTAGIWTQQAYLKASNTDAGDRFGEGPVLTVTRSWSGHV